MFRKKPIFVGQNSNLRLPVAVEGVVEPGNEGPDREEGDAAVVEPERDSGTIKCPPSPPLCSPAWTETQHVSALHFIQILNIFVYHLDPF